jgi:hypothetical protein
LTTFLELLLGSIFQGCNLLSDSGIGLLNWLRSETTVAPVCLLMRVGRRHDFRAWWTLEKQNIELSTEGFGTEVYVMKSAILTSVSWMVI